MSSTERREHSSAAKLSPAVIRAKDRTATASDESTATARRASSTPVVVSGNPPAHRRGTDAADGQYTELAAGEYCSLSAHEPILVALMATQMRRVLVDHARRRAAAKRRDSGVRIALDDAQAVDLRTEEDVLAVHQALTELEAVDARAGRMVELRYFAGVLEREAAGALGVSLATLKRDWSFVRAWLFDRLTRDAGASGGSGMSSRSRAAENRQQTETKSR